MHENLTHIDGDPFQLQNLGPNNELKYILKEDFFPYFFRSLEKIFLNVNTLQDLLNKQLQLTKKLVQMLEHDNKNFPAKGIYANCVSTFMLFRKSA